ncbi:MAG TPA: response regulator transcription factor [Gaiellaceae bacterium]
MSTTLLLAQDCALLRSGIRSTLDVSSGIEIVAETGAASELLTLTRRTHPDAVLLGLEMQGETTTTYLERVVAGVTGVSVIVVAKADRRAEADDLFCRGAASVILTTIELHELAPAIASVVNGARGLVFGERRASTQAQTDGLTNREVDMLQAVGSGLSNRAIAHQLSVTEHTVKFHLTSVYRKLSIQSRTEAAHWAVEHGLITRAFAGNRAI